MQLFSFSTDGNELGIGVKTSTGTFNLTKALDIFQRARGVEHPVSFIFLQVLVEMGYCSGNMIRGILDEPWVQSKRDSIRLATGVHIDIPIARPTKIIGIGRNYAAHAKELKNEIPSEPIFFAKAPSSLTAHDTHIVIPNWIEDRVDHEAELAVVIGKQGKNITESEAESYVAGYSIINDVTARTMQKTDRDANEPWFRSKNLDTFTPMGPYLVPADEISDVNDLQIQLTVNGKERQNGNTSDMIFPVPKLIAYLSKYMTLEPGDVIATGTPEGVSALENGDHVEITISDIGTLKNRVVRK